MARLSKIFALAGLSLLPLTGCDEKSSNKQNTNKYHSVPYLGDVSREEIYQYHLENSLEGWYFYDLPKEIKKYQPIEERRKIEKIRRGKEEDIPPPIFILIPP